MKTARKTKVTFDDMPRMMSALLDQMRTLTDRVKRLETPEGRPKTSSGREILTTMEVANMLVITYHGIQNGQQGRQPCYRNGKNLMFYRDEILEWVDSGRAQDY